ncbi:MAG: OmpA family protein [Alphaproteobacteria bacterium]|jgi:OOP family OmpA-OmpF porin|nr:OmpA family protein [Alphaproteobacteria bacterium]
MRFSTAILSAALLTGLSGAAQAQQAGSGLYTGLMGGYNILEDGSTSGGAINGKAEYEGGFAVLGALGWDYGRYSFGNLRSELELGYRRNGGDKVTGTATGVGTGNASGDVQAVSLMLNGLYDLPINFPVRPYVGAGLGGAWVDFDNIKTSTGTFLKDSEMQFAYQGIAGLGWEITNNWRANLDYRYFATLDPSVKHGNGTGVDTEYKNHTVMVGFAYKFAAPAPVPAAAAQPAAAQPAPVVAAQPAKPKEPKNFLVFFDFDKSEITPEAMKIIEQAVAYAKAGNMTRVELTGHADRSGSNKYNLALSMRRAKAVEAAMVKLGIAQNAIGVAGKGEEQPLVPTPDGVREPQNRRVEILLPQ